MVKGSPPMSGRRSSSPITGFEANLDGPSRWALGCQSRELSFG